MKFQRNQSIAYELEISREFMLRMKKYFPADHQHKYACMFCDMGQAGYSSMGEGTHDNECPYRTIIWYEEEFGKLD